MFYFYCIVSTYLLFCCPFLPALLAAFYVLQAQFKKLANDMGKGWHSSGSQ